MNILLAICCVIYICNIYLEIVSNFRKFAVVNQELARSCIFGLLKYHAQVSVCKRLLRKRRTRRISFSRRACCTDG